MDAVISLLVPSTVYEAVEAKLKRLAKRAEVPWERIPGETEIIVTEQVETGDVEPYLVKDVKRVLSCARIAVGALPRANGYTLVARLEHTEGGVILAYAPGESGLPESYREQANHCDHCQTKRHRNDTFVLRAADGSLKQVGRNCLADFLGADATRFVVRAELALLVTQMGEPSGWDDFAGFGGCRGYLPTYHFVACALASIERFGFIKSGREGATKDHAAWLCNVPPKEERARKEWRKQQPTEEQCARAAEIVAWGKSVDPSSEYLHNLRVALNCGAAEHSRQGLLASAPNAWMRAMGKERAPVVDAGHWGAVGKRASVDAELVRKTFTEGLYGSVAVCGFRTAEGHDLVWFASSDAPDLGWKGKLTATVKRHDERKGRKQTIVSRCKYETAPEPKPEPEKHQCEIATGYCHICGLHDGTT